MSFKSFHAEKNVVIDGKIRRWVGRLFHIFGGGKTNGATTHYGAHKRDVPVMIIREELCICYTRWLEMRQKIVIKQRVLYMYVRVANI